MAGRDGWYVDLLAGVAAIGIAVWFGAEYRAEGAAIVEAGAESDIGCPCPEVGGDRYALRGMYDIPIAGPEAAVEHAQAAPGEGLVQRPYDTGQGRTRHERH